VAALDPQFLSCQRTLLHIEQQIRRMSEVTCLEIKLRNWERHGMQWTAKHGTFG
jgi:hypothetical protein